LKYTGIDVSKWQGRIDWNLVKADGIQFAMIRATYGWGKENVDCFFNTNYECATRAGIPVGAYHYSYARTPEEAIKEAEHCYSVIKGKAFSYPIAYDMEESVVASLGKKRISQIAKAFCEKMEDYGYYVCIYANKHWLENYFEDEIFDNYDIWLAQWTNRPTFEKVYGIWQKSPKGTVNGIKGYVDLNESYKHYPSIMKANGLNGVTKGSPSKKTHKPAPKNYAMGEKVTLKHTKIYSASTSTMEMNVISGDYYIYDDKVINGRMRITNSKDKVNKKPTGQNVTGYVEKSDLR
jgi:GH25 family lysozyme M1 (1,4-beta-N-acetylmuramidase)